MIHAALAYFCLAWYAVILTAALGGFLCILAKFASPPKPVPGLPDAEPVTVIRPVKGIDPELESCLELSFLQNYPPLRLQILFCVFDAADPALPILRLLAAKYPHIDCQILILAPGSDYFGPNPKVNNLVKGFVHAKHDLLWIMDLNVWASRDVLVNSVAAITNNTNCQAPLGPRSRRVKLAHHVPLALSVHPKANGRGSLLDEMFLFTSHSKFYVSLNNLSVAPCVNGKSNMYRKSDLDHAVAQIPFKRCAFFTEPSVVDDARRIALKGPGHSIEFFARYIGEDNMIAIALWEYCHGRTALTGDVVIQPLESGNSSNSIKQYSERRVRWLRVRKYMVLAATLVEPTTESIICGIIGTFAVSKLVLARTFSWWFFAFHMACWLACDYKQYYVWVNNLHGTSEAPLWLQDLAPRHRSLAQWFQIWLMREVFALPIWVSAMIGHEIEWRGKPFRIKKDLSAEEL